MARISVVVASTNSKDLLLATLDSVLNQSCRDFELLIADDGSTDGTGLTLLSRLGPDPSRAERVWADCLNEVSGTRSVQMLRAGVLIHYLNNVTPRGHAAARNRAINAAGGEFLAFAEPGDVWKRGKLASMVELLDRHPELAACLECASARKPRARRQATLTRLEFEQILACKGLPLGGSLLRRSCLDPEAPFDENLPVCEEYDFWLRLGSRHSLARLAEAQQSSPPAPERSEWGLERFRVYALEKAYQGGHLDPGMRHRVAEELVRQCDQLVEGYRRRDNDERANFYDRKKKRFAQEVAKLNLSDPLYSRSPRALATA